MKGRSPLSLLIRGFLLVVLIILAVIALISIISWWAGWMFLEEFQRAVNLAGVLLIGVGVVGLVKELAVVRRSQLEDGHPEAAPGKDGQAPLDGLRKYAFTVIFMTAGAVCLLIGVLLV